MIDLKTLPQRAVNNQNLTPIERALLKVWQTLLIDAGITAALALAEYIQRGGTVDVQHITTIFLTGFVIALSHGVLKYLSAQNDPQLSKDATALDAAISKAAGDIAHGNPDIATDLEQIGLSLMPVFDEVTGTSITQRIPVVSVPAPDSTVIPVAQDTANAQPGK